MTWFFPLTDDCTKRVRRDLYKSNMSTIWQCGIHLGFVPNKQTIKLNKNVTFAHLSVQKTKYCLPNVSFLMYMKENLINLSFS